MCVCIAVTCGHYYLDGGGDDDIGWGRFVRLHLIWCVVLLLTMTPSCACKSCPEFSLQNRWAGCAGFVGSWVTRNGCWFSFAKIRVSSLINVTPRSMIELKHTTHNKSNFLSLNNNISVYYCVDPRSELLIFVSSVMFCNPFSQIAILLNLFSLYTLKRKCEIFGLFKRFVWHAYNRQVHQYRVAILLKLEEWGWGT